MSLSLYIDTARWRAHQQSVVAAYPGLVPVAKGNGYGFTNLRLAEEAALLGADTLAVGTTHEAAVVKDYFSGDLMVLTPYRIQEEPVPLPDRVVRTVSTVDGAAHLRGARIVVECMTSLKRHGIAPGDLGKLHALIGDGVRIEGFAVHMPMDRPDGSDAVAEIAQWVDAIRASMLPLQSMFVSHVTPDQLTRLQRQYPDVRFRSRIGTHLWLGDHGAIECRGMVLDVVPVAKGERFGYRQHKAPSDGHLVVVAGGTAHGVGLEAPKAVAGLAPRAKGIARAGLATVNRTLSPFLWQGKQRWFAEPPHMQVSILFVSSETQPPQVGEELPARLRHTTTTFDRLVDGWQSRP
ncbi:alanine racemase [Mangrovactinospora gilvigrisea]|uniref:Alanine racemase n=1 Tax=Mangrovactinospora gilvigrisea TaxID=1428644 RepID=A0A1J7BFQ8_9ACTN|nr:alanine racemase [Mangrovactinospora gilvigrisea]OIV37519.1 alanine racemase [Mangrovactinospora gilvigrisea]